MRPSMPSLLCARVGDIGARAGRGRNPPRGRTTRRAARSRSATPGVARPVDVRLRAAPTLPSGTMFDRWCDLPQATRGSLSSERDHTRMHHRRVTSYIARFAAPASALLLAASCSSASPNGDDTEVAVTEAPLTALLQPFAGRNWNVRD